MLFKRLSAAGIVAGVCLAGLVSGPARADEPKSIPSFDGTKITFYWFPAVGSGPAPTVLQGPGFGGQAQDDPDAKSGTSIPGVGDLRRAGYNVLTWNPRGIAPSGGEAMLDNPDYEGRDVSALIDWVAKQPDAKLDAPGDPRVGMTGGSYGGAVQLAAAGIDKRIDVIVPVIAWHSLENSLYPAKTIKTAWVDTLMTGASLPGRTFSPRILKGREQAAKGITFSPSVVRFAKAAGPDQVIGNITAPTLLIQGTIDNLFPPTEAVRTYRTLRANKTPVKMIWFCGGHGICLTEGADSTLPVEQTWLWLRRHLDGETGVDTGPGFTWIDQRGKFRSAPTYPKPTGSIAATGDGTLKLRRKGGSGPYPGKAPEGVSPLTWLLLAKTIPTPAKKSINVTVRARRSTVILGQPKVRLRYKGNSKSKKVRVLAQLVDQRTGTVVGNQITAVPLRLDGRIRRTTVRLEAVSATLRKGQRLRLQITSQSSAFDVRPRGGQVDFTKIRVQLPTQRG